MYKYSDDKIKNLPSVYCKMTRIFHGFVGRILFRNPIKLTPTNILELPYVIRTANQNARTISNILRETLVNIQHFRVIEKAKRYHYNRTRIKNKIHYRHNQGKEMRRSFTDCSFVFICISTVIIYHFYEFEVYYIFTVNTDINNYKGSTGNVAFCK